MSSKTPYKVLCVCLGNICRSPTAEIVLRHFCDEQQLNVLVDSAGTSNYHPGKAPDLRSQKHALKRGYDLSRLRARQLNIQDFVEFDLILAMDFENLSNIQSLMRRAEAELGSLRAEIALMSEHDPHYTQQELPDPYYGEADGFERVLDQCESSSRAWVQVLQQQFELKVKV
ncbi:low molecular weight protein-tyrosine-phosphatase [Acinetobacter towneri]|uniref:low molecular weight protein-tyrosine-phosphatase n=1 Tax=Acinetobacter towneri TaxID=202956 RepID=UPI001F3F0742|nr:low molecular weight protein-tyrosine-phosphatase [Acinetobacter towneri]UIP26178.1 low molecular weight phosphotyrosine protein phosphatase [Acinetobacter towneri]